MDDGAAAAAAAAMAGMPAPFTHQEFALSQQAIMAQQQASGVLRQHHQTPATTPHQLLPNANANNPKRSHSSSSSASFSGPKANWVIHKDWKLKKILGSGAYGEVYQAVEIKSNTKVAIKLDTRNNSEMEREIEYLKLLNGTSQHIPQILEYGRFSGISYFVLTLLGKNLSDLKRKRPYRRFSLSTTLRCARQMVWALRDVHEKKIIHRDIKPANFAIGRVNRQRIYIFDFGLASEYNEGPERSTVGFRGTNTYASIRVHQYKDPGRVDDLWSWLYCVLRLLGMKFPWDKVKIPQKAERCGSRTIKEMYMRLQPTPDDAKRASKEKMKDRLKQERKKVQEEFLKVKRECDLNQLLQDAKRKYDFPADAFGKIVAHLNELKYNSRPNYELIDNVFQTTLDTLGIKMDMPYDWEEGSFFGVKDLGL